MGYSIRIDYLQVELKINFNELLQKFNVKSENIFFAKTGKMKGLHYFNNVTEQGSSTVWLKKINNDNVEIAGIYSSKSIYSRNGSWFIDTLKKTIIEKKGSMIFQSPDYSSFIIYNGIEIFGTRNDKPVFINDENRNLPEYNIPDVSNVQIQFIKTKTPL